MDTFFLKYQYVFIILLIKGCLDLNLGFLKGIHLLLCF